MKRKCKENAHTWKAETGSSQSDKFSFCVQNVQLFFVLVVVNCGQSQQVWRIAAVVLINKPKHVCK